MLKINIDMWLKYGEKMNDVGHKALELSRDAGEDIEKLEVVLKMWRMIVSDMTIVQASRNLGGTFEVV